jgi:hypothetical protein
VIRSNFIGLSSGYDSGDRLPMNVLDDGATLGVATIAKLASAEGRKVALVTRVRMKS